MRSLYAAAAALTALAVSVLLLVAALTAEVDVGVTPEDPGGVVTTVVPGDPAWEAGIREGQRVVSITPADEPGGWALETTDGTDTHHVSSAYANAALRNSSVAAVAGAVAALLSLRLLRARARNSEALSSIAFGLASGTAVVLGAEPVSRAAILLAVVAPAAWVSRWPPAGRERAAALVGAACMLGVLGGVGLAAAKGEAARWLLLAWAAAAALGAGVVVVRWTGVSARAAAGGVRALTVTDAVVATSLALLAVALWASAVPAPWLLAGCGLTVLAYARWRRAVRAGLDRLLFADLREQAAMRAAEDERTRLARDIHDDPLQAIAGVIRQLEGPDPDAAAARESLRDAAARLRAVANDLHPPVLDDLGLVPAIEAAARAAGGAVLIEVDVADSTGYAADGRPPGDVELAAYRIVAEALANAVRHSGGTRVSVRGSVSAGRIELTVDDDGVGLPPGRAEAALREGRIGLASMRQRAAAAGARLDVGRRPERGTVIFLRWPA